MSDRSDAMRSKLALMSIGSAQGPMRRIIRSRARKLVYDYATNRYIVDFNDSVLVEQVHRDFRSDVINDSQSFLDDVTSATTIAEILVVFDAVAPWIE